MSVIFCHELIALTFPTEVPLKSQISRIIPLSSGNFVKISAGSIFENSFVKANGPAVQNIVNNAGYVKYTLDLANNQLINGNSLNYNQSKIEPF